MGLPDLAPLCIQITDVSGGLCVTFPGGFTVCAQAGFETGDPLEMARSLISQVNTALAPLAPFFNIIDLLKAIGDCIQAIPDALGPPPDPTAIINCVPGLVEKLNELLKLIPALTVPGLVKDIIGALVFTLSGIRQQLSAMLNQLTRIAAAATAAAETGNLDLLIVVDCETGNLETTLNNLNAGMEPLNRLIGIVNLLCGIVGLPCVPTLNGVELTQAALIPIDEAIALLQSIAAALPSLALPAIKVVEPGGKCD